MRSFAAIWLTVLSIVYSTHADAASLIGCWALRGDRVCGSKITLLKDQLFVGLNLGPDGLMHIVFTDCNSGYNPAYSTYEVIGSEVLMRHDEGDDVKCKFKVTDEGKTLTLMHCDWEGTYKLEATNVVVQDGSPYCPEP